MTENTRIIEFPIDAIVDSDMTIRVFKTVTVKIIVTKPNKDGEFSIITQIGDESPNTKITNIKNNNIVKDT